MKRNFFFISAIAMLLLSIVAFSDNLFYDVNQKSNSDPKFILHGLFFLAWFVVYVVQTGYVRSKNYKAHIALGTTGMLIGLGVVLSTFYVFVAVYKGWSVMPFYVKANRLFTVSFAILLWLAYRHRKKAVKHKRLLYIGNLYVLGPILDRVADKAGIKVDLHFDIFEGLIWNTFFVSLFAYDWTVLKKIHPISWIGFVWFYLVWVVAFLL